jgi:hypothetical protein
VGTYAFVNPLIAVILGWAILGETLGTAAGVATTLIVGAVVAIHRSRATRRTPTSSPPLDPVAVRTGSVEVEYAARRVASADLSGVPGGPSRPDLT